MSGLDKTAVSTSKPKATGAIWIAPLGTALPSSAHEALNPAFKNLGYISEDGISHSIEADTEEKTAFGGEVVSKSTTKHAEKASFSLLQNDKEVFEFLYGAENVTGDISSNNLCIKHTAKETDHYALVIELVLDGGRILRKVVPNGQPTKPDEVSYKDGELLAYKTEVSMFTDEHQVYAYDHFAQATQPAVTRASERG